MKMMFVVVLVLMLVMVVSMLMVVVVFVKVLVLYVQEYGSVGCLLILVFGLGGGVWVWVGLLLYLQVYYYVYVVMLLGFDGIVVLVGGNFIQQVEDVLVDFICMCYLVKLVLVGYSFGGIVLFKLVSDYFELVGGVVVVDGLLVFLGIENLFVEWCLVMVVVMQVCMQGLMLVQFEVQQVGFMQLMGVFDFVQVECYGKCNVVSDLKVVVQYMVEDLVLDFCDVLVYVNVLLLEILLYNLLDFVSGLQVMSEQQKVDYYCSLLVKVLQVKVVLIVLVCYFVMFDQKEKFEVVLDDFLVCFFLLIVEY